MSRLAGLPNSFRLGARSRPELGYPTQISDSPACSSVILFNRNRDQLCTWWCASLERDSWKKIETKDFKLVKTVREICVLSRKSVWAVSPRRMMTFSPSSRPQSSQPTHKAPLRLPPSLASKPLVVIPGLLWNPFILSWGLPSSLWGSPCLWCSCSLGGSHCFWYPCSLWGPISLRGPAFLWGPISSLPQASQPIIGAISSLSMAS